MIYVWGSGSIGKRHLANLTSLGVKRIGLISRGVQEEIPNLQEIWTPADVDWKMVSELIIATPTSLHLSNLKTALQGGVKKIYLEKPISHNNDRIEEISSLITLCGAKVFVGFDLRYDLGLVKVKELVQKQALGGVTIVATTPQAYFPPYHYKRNENGDVLSAPGEEYWNASVPFEGAMVDYLDELQTLSGGDFEVEWTHGSKASKLVHPSSSYTAVAQDVKDGLVDMAVGESSSFILPSALWIQVILKMKTGKPHFFPAFQPLAIVDDLFQVLYG